MSTDNVDPSTGEIMLPTAGFFEPVFLRTPYNYDRQAASRAAGLNCCDPSLAQQQFAEDADINVIVRRFGITGQMPQGIRIPTYGDFEGISDFQSALAALDRATGAFEALPADIRATFQNDPGLFVDFCSDPNNLPALRELGLAETPPPAPTPPAPPPPKQGGKGAVQDPPHNDSP